MENYNNYQEIIEALKAKYVDARNLKRQAKVKKREILNSGSFLTRKETEKSVTDTKSGSIGDLIDSTMSNSFEAIETGKQNTYRIALAELKAELALIDAQMSKLMGFNEIDPEAHPEKTDAELQSLNLVRGMINNAIYQAESTFEEAYSNYNYVTIKDQFSPGIGTSTDEEIRDHYSSLDSKFVSLFMEAKSAIDGFVIEYKDLTLAARDLKRNLYSGISNIEFLKSQLSDLLQNGGSESEISAKESDIESEKETLLNKANDLKRKNTERNVLVNSFGDKVSTYFDSLDEMRSGMIGFFQSNSQILISHYPNTSNKIQVKMLNLTNTFLVCLEEFFGTIPDGNGNYYSLLEILREDFNETGDNWTQERRMGLYSHDMNEIIDSPMDRLFTNTEDENGNPSFEFKKAVSEESKEEIIEYYDRLNSAFSPYMERMASISSERDKIWDTFNKLDELDSKHLQFTQVFSRSISNLKWSEREASNFYQGRYTGTSEQESLYSSAFDSMISAERSYEFTKQVANVASLKWARFNHIFPGFYSSLDSLLSAKSNTQSAFDSAEAQKLVLISEDNTAYDLLQTLTAGETSYLQALYEYEKNSNEVQLAINGNNLLVAAANQSYDFLQTTLSGEAEYQAALPEIQEPSTPPLYTNEYVANVTALHYVYLGAQSDYDTKDAARVSDYETNVAPFIVLRDNALVALQDLTDEDAAYQSALSDWTNKNTVKNDFINTVWLSASNDRDAAIVAYNSHVGGSYSFEDMINVSGQFLVDILDAKNINVELIQNGVKYNAWMDAESAYEQIKSQMTFEPALDEDKLKARRDYLPMQYKAYKVRQWWFGKVVQHLEYLHNYKNQFFEAVDFINSMSDSETDSILQDGIDFLTNTQQNLRYRKQRDQYFHDFKWYESHLRKNHNRLVSQEIDSLGTLMSYAAPDADLLTIMKSSTFLQTVQSMFEDTLLEGAHSGFANNVISWVENGGRFSV